MVEHHRFVWGRQGEVLLFWGDQGLPPLTDDLLDDPSVGALEQHAYGQAS